MIKTGQKFDVNFEALKLSDLAKSQLPALYHLGTGQHMTSLNNQNTGKCLRNNHLVKTGRLDSMHKTRARPIDLQTLKQV